MHDVMSMLPPPRVPSRPKWPSADTIAALVDEDAAAPIRRADEAQRAAARAVDDLERHRPGQLGTKWREALEADAADYAAGTIPSKWRAAQLLEADPDRWAYARVVCGAVARAWRRADKELDRAAMAKKCRVVMDDAARRFEKVAADGWAVADNPHAAWPFVAEGQAIIAEHRAAQVVLTWLAGTGAAPQLGDRDALGWSAEGLPGGPEAAGHWICLDLALNPRKKLLGIPKGAAWPKGAERLLGLAIPAGAGLSQLMNRGVAEAKEVV